MTPKEKAEELVNIFGKELSIKCVDEIMHHIRWSLAYGYEKQLEYFQEVKNEIELL